MDMEKQHHRRPHYSGRYPRHFAEKYKELQPEKYQDEIAHVIAKGHTPAGMHIPIMVQEILDILKIQPGERGFDATLGYGGHTLAMLKELQGRGHLISGDIDPIESVKTAARIREQGYSEDLWELRHMNFCQIDDPQRGFTYRADGPLDLRLDPTSGISAAERLADIDRDELIGLLEANADESYAEPIARQIVKQRRRSPIRTTRELHEAIAAALEHVPLPAEMQAEVGHSPKREAAARQELIRKSSARVFQALRIDINHEYEVLYDFMEKLPYALAPGGRAAILTFHSGEDRIVKKAFKAYKQQGLYADIARDVIRPSREECYRNSRAHSTKLRWAIRAE